MMAAMAHGGERLLQRLVELLVLVLRARRLGRLLQQRARALRPPAEDRPPVSGLALLRHDMALRLNFARGRNTPKP
jgi:hypothetical protein